MVAADSLFDIPQAVEAEGVLTEKEEELGLAGVSWRTYWTYLRAGSLAFRLLGNTSLQQLAAVSCYSSSYALSSSTSAQRYSPLCGCPSGWNKAIK